MKNFGSARKAGKLRNTKPCRRARFTGALLGGQIALVIAAGALLGWSAFAQEHSPVETAADTTAFPDDCNADGPAFRSSVYVCDGADLLPADWFLATEGLAPAEPRDAEEPSPPPPGPNTATSDVQGSGVDGERQNVGTAYITREALWADGVNGAEQVDGVLEIPVCWINPTADPQETEARIIVREAIEATWNKAAAVKFINWTKCLPERTGGVRILIDDSGPRAYVGRRAGAEPVSMWLNFTFSKWSRTCAKLDSRVDDFRFEYCVYSIAVHEFGHVLGYFHEHDRLFHGAEIHELSGNELARQKAVCAASGQTGPTTPQGPGESLLTTYDPMSVMNYCYNIYNHRAKLTPLDVAGAVLAYGELPQ